MSRRLIDNVWVDGVMYPAGAVEGLDGPSGVPAGVAAGLGDHVWHGQDQAAAATPQEAIQAPEAPEAAEDGPVPAPQPDIDGDGDADPAPVSPDRPVAEPGPSPADLTPEESGPSPFGRAQPPPHSGPGSSAAAWRDYAKANGVTVEDDAKRPDVIDALKAAGVAVGEE